MYLRVVISYEDHLRELGMTCYIVTGLYGDNIWFAISLKTLMDWAEYNQDYLLHLTQTTILIPPSDPPVCPSLLRPTRSHIVPVFMVLKFLLHHNSTPSSVHTNLLKSPPPSASGHTATALIHKISSQGFPTVVRDPWFMHTIQAE